MSLTTLDRVKAELRGTEAQKPAGTDQQIMGYIYAVTTRILNFGWKFEPVYYTRRLTANPMNVNTYVNTLQLGDNLLEPTAIENNGTALSYLGDVLPYPNDGQFPIRVLRLTGCSGCVTWYPTSCASCPPIETITITGFWGFHQNPDTFTGGWLPSTDSITTLGGINAGAGSFTVNDVDGEDSLNRTPRFSAGNLIRIDDEMMLILETDTTTNTLTVRRGVNKSVRASHAAAAPISVWEAEEAVIAMATRQTCLLYARRGSYQQITTLPEGVSVTYPSDLLSEIKNTLQMYNYL